MNMTVNDLSKSYGGRVVLSHVNAVFAPGSRTCVMGPSGIGKTTFLRLLMGLEQPTGGTVEVSARVSAVFQEDRLLEDFHAVTNLRAVLGRRVSREAILACLLDLGLRREDVCRPVRELSGGMKRRVAIARALLADGELLLLDEPFRGLDEATRLLAIRTVMARSVGRTLVAVTHDPRDAEALGAEVLTLSAPD